jgi:two-component system, sensor histidine kinase and response regulator
MTSAFKKHKGDDPALKQRLLLLAEDHPLNQKVAVLLLERMGFQLHVVANGDQAFKSVQRQAYDAVLMDCHMPEVDGFEATRRIRHWEQDTGNHVPIIAVTALAMHGDRERCLAAGMDDYITKPIDRELLHQKLVYWINPGSTSSLQDAGKVIRIFDPAFSLHVEAQEEPVNVRQLYDAYGAEGKDLLDLFAHSSERLVADLTEALQQENPGRIAALSHELKGASWAVGADEMARLAVFLEQAACQENWRLAQRTFVRLQHHFVEVKRFVQTCLLSSVDPTSPTNPANSTDSTPSVQL